jgi:hypothetical protein
MSREAPLADAVVGISMFLLIVFVIFKVCGLIVWSWWWVLAPLWIPGAAVVLVLAFVGLVILLGGMDAIEF